MAFMYYNELDEKERHNVDKLVFTTDDVLNNSLSILRRVRATATPTDRVSIDSTIAHLTMELTLFRLLLSEITANNNKFEPPTNTDWDKVNEIVTKIGNMTASPPLLI